MKGLEMRAKTVEEAIQRTLRKLDVTREKVEVTVLKEGRQGILGLGTEEAKVRVEVLPSMAKNESNVDEIAKGVLETLLNLMGMVVSVEPCAEPFVEEEGETTTPVTFDIKGDDLGILIGRRGQTLANLQYMVRLMVTYQTGTWVPITIDVEGYKQRRYKALQTLAWRMAEQVKVRGAPFTLEPMSAYERRIIHLALADHSDVTTQSTGEGEERKVVILPRGQ